MVFVCVLAVFMLPGSVQAQQLFLGGQNSAPTSIYNKPSESRSVPRIHLNPAPDARGVFTRRDQGLSNRNTSSADAALILQTEQQNQRIRAAQDALIAQDLRRNNQEINAFLAQMDQRRARQMRVNQQRLLNQQQARQALLGLTDTGLLANNTPAPVPTSIPARTAPSSGTQIFVRPQRSDSPKRLFNPY